MVLRCDFLLLFKGIRGGVLLSILVTTIIAIFAGVVDLGSIDWHAASLTSSIKDLGQVFWCSAWI